METQNQTFNQRWHKLEAAKTQTRKIAFTLMAAFLTSLLVAVTSAAG